MPAIRAVALRDGILSVEAARDARGIAIMVVSRVSEGELATNLQELLARVRTGERFEIERDGEVIATLAPSGTPRGITWGEFVGLYYDLPRPDDRFADDLEAVQAEQELMPKRHEWPEGAR